MKKVKIFSVILSLVFVFISVVPAFSVNIEVENNDSEEPFQSEYENEFNKLHFYFGSEKMSDSKASTFALTKIGTSETNDYTYIDDNSELNSAIQKMDSYYEDCADDEPITMTVEFKSDFANTDEFINFSKERETVETIDELRNFRERLATFSKEYHRNETLSNLEKLNRLDFDSIELIDYSPFVKLEIDKNNVTTENLINLAADDGIVNVSLSLNDETQDEATWTRTMKEIGAYSTISSSLYTGEGIRVGVLELAVCEPTHKNLTGKSITIESGYNNDTLVVEDDDTGEKKRDLIDHANKVTSIIALMAPDAEIYASRNTNNGMGWFIEEGCDVVNCSFSRYIPTIQNTDGTYGYNDAQYMYYFDGLIDYQIKTHFISVVASAGNLRSDNTQANYNPMKQIRSPGLAYNAITVGGLECTLGFFDYELEYDSSACYVTTTNRTKPEISALFDVNIPNIGTCSGTSFSAPQVTGTIALMMCKYVRHALYPHAVKAMLISGAKETEGFTNINGSCFDDKVGAGCVNLLNIRNSECVIYFTTSNSMNSINNYIYTYNVSLKKNDVLQSSISWFAEVDYINQTCQISNLDIHIYDSSNNLVCSSSLGDFTNSEFVRYKASSAGTYTINVYQNGTLPSGIEDQPFAFVCNIL